MSDDVAAAARAASSVLFEVVADFGPGILPRLLQPLSRRNLVPERFAARLEAGALAVEIRLADVPKEMLALIEGNLRQVVGVRTLASRSGPKISMSDGPPTVVAAWEASERRGESGDAFGHPSGGEDADVWKHRRRA